MLATPGERFRAVRDALGYSLDRLARALGVSKTTVQRWEQGPERDGGLEIKPKHVEALTALGNFGATVNAWITYGGEKPRELIKAERARAAADAKPRAS